MTMTPDRRAAMDLSDMLADIPAPVMTVPAFTPDHVTAGAVPLAQKDLFAPDKRKAWNEGGEIPRCDFAPGKNRIVCRSTDFVVHCVWKRSLYGPSLQEVKQDPEQPARFAGAVADLVSRSLGHNLCRGGWAVVAPPPRRHTVNNFAYSAAALLAHFLNIPFFRDIAVCNSRQRVGAEYSFPEGLIPPLVPNLIVFDDIVTTGSTLSSMFRLLSQAGYNLFFVVGIDNKK